MNIRNSFTILSYLFRMSANKLSYEKFTKELRKKLRKTYDRLESYETVTGELRIVYEKFTILFITLSYHFRKCILPSFVNQQTTDHATKKCQFLTRLAHFLKTLTDTSIVLYFTVVFIHIYSHIQCTRLQSVSWLLKILIDWLIDWVPYRRWERSRHRREVPQWRPRTIRQRTATSISTAATTRKTKKKHLQKYCVHCPDRSSVFYIARKSRAHINRAKILC